MTLDAAEINQVIELAARVAAETSRNMIRGTGGATLPFPLTRLGVVGGRANAGAEVYVRADGDLNAVPAVNATGATVEAGDRVVIEWRAQGKVHVVHQLSRAERGNWTPSVGAGGNDATATQAGHYVRHGHLVTVYGKWVAGASSGIAAEAPWAGLPFPAISDGDGLPALIDAWVYDVSFPRRYRAVWEIPEGATSGKAFVPLNAGVGYDVNVAVGATAPMTWAVDDAIFFHGTYNTDAA